MQKYFIFAYLVVLFFIYQYNIDVFYVGYQIFLAHRLVSKWQISVAWILICMYLLGLVCCAVRRYWMIDIFYHFNIDIYIYFLRTQSKMFFIPPLQRRGGYPALSMCVCHIFLTIYYLYKITAFFVYLHQSGGITIH